MGAPTWTAEADAQLRQLAEQKLTATEIAFRMRASRNAVIGRARRRGIKIGQWRSPQEEMQHGAVPKRLRSDFRRVKKRETPMLYVKDERPVRTVPQDCPPPKNLTILQLRDGDCRWPVNEPSLRSLGEGGGYLFCALAAEGNSSYCAYHTRLAHPLVPPAR